MPDNNLPAWGKEKLRFRGWSKNQDYYCWTKTPKAATFLLRQQALKRVGSYKFESLEVEYPAYSNKYIKIGLNLDAPAYKNNKY